MLIINNTHKVTERNILNYLPGKIREIMYKIEIDNLEEIRLRRGKPVMLIFRDKSMYINENGKISDSADRSVRVGKAEIDEAMELITSASVYAAEDEIKKGFVTVNGGHRVGICGRAVMKDGEVAFIKEINALNYRFAHDIEGSADNILNNIYNNGTIHNTLIISPPQCGKTTVLRDIARQLSKKNIKVGIVDERGEIAGVNSGNMGYELGSSVDVLSFCRKDAGMVMLLRSMSPDVIITDEIGTASDVKAVEKLINSGVSVITSIHARNRGDLKKREEMSRLYSLFGCFVTLSRRNGAGTLEEVYCND